MKSNRSNEERILETSKFALDRSKCSVISTPSWQVNYHIYYFMEDILIFLTWDISPYSPGWPVTQLCSPSPSITSCPSLPCPLPHRSYSPSFLSFLSFCFSLASTWKHTCCIHFFVKWFISLNIVICYLSISSKRYFILLDDLVKIFITHPIFFSHSFVDEYPAWIYNLAATNSTIINMDIQLSLQ